LLLLFATAFTLSSCSDYLKGKPKNQEQLELKSNELECLSTSDELIKSLFNETVQKENISSFSSCLQKSFQLFSEKTRGADVSEYTADELYSFFSKYLIKNEHFHIGLIQAVLKLKAAFIGGSDKSLTKTEIPKINHLIKDLETEAISLLPVLPILSFSKEKDTVSEAEIKNAVGLLYKSLVKLFDQVEFEKSNYSFEDMSHLVNSISQFRGKPNYENELDLAQSILQIYFGSPMSLTRKKEWFESLQTSAEIFEVGLRYYYFVFKHELNAKNTLSALSHLLVDGLKTIQKSSAMKYQGQIRWTDLDHVIDLVYILDPQLIGLSRDTLKDIYKVVLSRTTRFGRTQMSLEPAFQRESLEFLMRELENWISNQSQIDKVFAGGDSVISTQSFLLKSRSVMGSTNFQFFKNTISNDPADLWTIDALPFIGYPRANFKVSWQGQTYQNLIRTLSRLLILGYGNSGTNGNSTSVELTEQGLTEWFKEFDRLGRELKMFDPRSLNAGSRSFKEANLFTFSSDGKGNLSSQETFEFLSLLFGGGTGNSDLVTQLMHDKNCEVNQLDVFGYKKLKEECFKNNFIQNYSFLFKNLPDQALYFASLSKERKKIFFDELLMASRTSDPHGKLIETADVRTMVMILLYNESLFVKFDADRSKTLSIKELENASIRFSGFFKELSPIKSEAFIRELFIYVVFKGKRPTASELSWFKIQRMTGSYKTVDRLDLIKVFATLKEALKN